MNIFLRYDKRTYLKKIFKISSLLLSIPISIYIFITLTTLLTRDVSATTETRYFRSDTQSVNSLTAYKLDTTQSSSNLSTTVNTSGTGEGTSYWGIRVWKRNSSGTETELTSGTPVAQVTRTAAGSGLQSTTWTPPETTLSTTDSIVVRVYLKVNSGSWLQGGTAPIYTSEQLGSTLLEALPWTVYYYTQDSRSNSGPPNSRYINITYYWGNSSYNSRIENFVHSSSTTVLTVGSYGTQRTSVEPNTTDIHMGGAFTFVRSASSTNVTSITISNTGTVADSDLTEMDLYYKVESTCSEAMPVDATLFNSSSGTFSSGSSTVTGTMNVTASQVCLYVDLDIGSGAENDETIELQITNPSTQVSVSTGTVTPATAVAISGTTTVASNQGPSFTVFSDNGPKEPGNDITFTATSTDPNGDTVSIAVCKTTGYTTDTEWNVNYGHYIQSTSASHSYGLYFKNDGTKLYLVTGYIGRTVIQYSMSLAWDVSTKSWDATYDIASAQDNDPEGIFFSSDGTKMYIIGQQNDSIFQYTLSTAWDVSTASYASKSFSVASQDSTPRGIYFNSDGTLMFIGGSSSDSVYQYTLSTGWDISTASYASKSFSVNSQDATPLGFTLNSDGTKMYMAGDTNNTLYQYTLSTAWDISTASYSSKSLSVSSQSTDPAGLFWGNDGTRMYLTDPSDNMLYQYNLPIISCDGGESDTWCFSYLQASNPSCAYSIPIPTPDTSYNVYPYVFDMFDEPSTSELQGALDTYTVANSTPIVSGVTINSGSAITLTEGTTTAVTLTGTVTDYNSCYNSEISSVYGYVYRSGIGTDNGDSFDVSYTETLPYQSYMSPDGTNMYILGADKDSIFQHTLSTAWDVSTAKYVNKSFYIGTQELGPKGLTLKPDGTKMYIVGENNTVYQYSLSTAWDISSASYDSKSISVSLANPPHDIVFNTDGTSMYILEASVGSPDYVFQYTLSTAWDVSTATYASKSFVSDSQDSYPYGFAFKSDGTGMYIVGGSSDTVYQYTLSTAWDISTASYVSKSYSVTSQETDPMDIIFNSDGTKMYIFGYNSDTVHQYSLSTGWDVSSASYANKSFAITSQESNPVGITYSSDGTKMYILGTTNDTVYQYTLSTAWDITSSSYASKSFSVASQEATPTDLFFNSDGTSMYVVGATNDTVYQYTLSTGWDVSTATYASKSVSVNSQEDTPIGVAFSSDGTKMYAIGTTNDTVYQYTLSTGWDVSSATYASKSFSVTTQQNTPYDLSFNSDGTKMYVVGTTGDLVSQYTLSTGWDVSSSSYASKAYSVTSQSTAPWGMSISPDGSKLYILDLTSTAVYQYPMLTAWDISTANWYGTARNACDSSGEANNSYCYPEITCSYVADSCTGITDSSSNYTCSVNLYSYADPTDAGTPYSTEYWVDTLKATDNNSASGTGETSTGVKLNSLIAFSITSSINYGSLGLSESNDPLDITTTTTPTGNVGLDHEVYGPEYMCSDYPTCSGYTIPVGNQKYALSASTAYASGTALSTTPTEAEISIVKPTSGTPTTGTMWWGIYIPPATQATTFYGSITVNGLKSEASEW